MKRSVNKDFKIKVNGVNFIGPSISKTVGIKGLKELVGSHADRMIEQAQASQEDTPTFKLRRGLTIRFYSK